MRREGSGVGEEDLSGCETERRDAVDLRFCSGGIDLRRSSRSETEPAVCETDCAGFFDCKETVSTD